MKNKKLFVCEVVSKTLIPMAKQLKLKVKHFEKV